MEITHHQVEEQVELRLRGRLDGYWSDHFATALEKYVREGAPQIHVNLAEVTFLTSAGIRILVKFHKQLADIRGSLVVISPSEPVKRILDMSGLTALLLRPEVTRERHVPPAQDASAVRSGIAVHRALFAGQLFDRAPEGQLECRLIGDPGLLRGCRFRAEHVRKVAFGDGTFGLGLGALGDSFADCQGRFGEFLAAGGAVTYLPTDGTNVPDYLVAFGRAVPEMQVRYGLLCTGTPRWLLRFEAHKEEGPLALSDLVEACLDMGQGDAMGLVAVLESAGLMGAALRRSPALEGAAGEAPFLFPDTRNWLTFTAERAHWNALALVVGVAARQADGPFAPLLRPLGRNPTPVGHCHAAALSYRPLAKGNIEMRSTVASLFEAQTLQGILHLLGIFDLLSASAKANSFVAPAGSDRSRLLLGKGPEMSLLLSAWTVGLILSLLALGVLITFRIFNFPDITAEGSFTLGGAVLAVMIVGGVPAAVAAVIAFACGMLAGMTTGVLYARFKINPLLSGILVMTGLFSVNLRIMGKSNLPLPPGPPGSSFTFLGWRVGLQELTMLVMMLAITFVIGCLCYAFFRTNLGAAMRATGDNDQMIRALGVNVGSMTILGVALANGLIALSGALMAQYQGSADVQMGIGMVVWGLASVIIGEALVGTRQLGLTIVGAVMGSVLFRLLVALVLMAGLNPNDLKLITAIFVFIALILPRLLGQWRSRRGALKHA